MILSSLTKIILLITMIVYILEIELHFFMKINYKNSMYRVKTLLMMIHE